MQGEHWVSIQNWPANERPREKLLSKGAETLSDAELLAIFIHTGTAGKNALDLAREALIKAGDIRRLLNQSQLEFCQQPGLGRARFATLQAALEVSRRYLEQATIRDAVIESPQQTRLFLRAQLRDCKNEQFACLFLDNRHRTIAFEQLFAGSISSASVYPRVVVQRALFHNAAAVIFAHNHPSGIAEPSQADIEITAALKRSLNLIDVRVLDHLIVADNSIASLMELGQM